MYVYVSVPALKHIFDAHRCSRNTVGRPARSQRVRRASGSSPFVAQAPQPWGGNVMPGCDEKTQGLHYFGGFPPRKSSRLLIIYNVI